MTSETDKKALLGQLRIDRSEPPPSTGLSRRTWIVAGAIALAALLAAVAWLAPPLHTVTAVHTVSAQPIGGGSSGTSVLDATGYVTAR
ncbi:MAG TPA: hypothetical protein VGH75_04370, partial [Steroidobacteraceae bacterium]